MSKNEEKITPVTEELTEETKVKKPRKPREKVRSEEELLELPVNKLTEKEKDILIKKLREENNVFDNKLTAMDQTVRGAFQKYNELEEKYNAMETYYQQILQKLKLQTDAFYSAVNVYVA